MCEELKKQKSRRRNLETREANFQKMRDREVGTYRELLEAGLVASVRPQIGAYGEV
jgi:hypothetical protein